MEGSEKAGSCIYAKRESKLVGTLARGRYRHSPLRPAQPDPQSAWAEAYSILPLPKVALCAFAVSGIATRLDFASRPTAPRLAAQVADSNEE